MKEHPHRPAAAILWACLVGWASTAGAADDPLDDLNKVIHDFNASVAGMAGDAKGWTEAGAAFAGLPPEVRDGLGHFYANMNEPVIAVSSLIAGDLENSRLALRRFLINLTLGLGGIHDAAAEMGVRSAPTTLSEALCRTGVPDGPFLIIPFYGPATLSDFVTAMVGPTAGFYAFGYAFVAFRAGALLINPGAGTPAPAAATADYDDLKRRYLAERRRACETLPAHPSEVAEAPAHQEITPIRQ